VGSFNLAVLMEETVMASNSLTSDQGEGLLKSTCTFVVTKVPKIPA
jgi:hypothetical protein